MLCQQDSYKIECDATVLSCTQNDIGWEVETTATLLYPKGGGQPSDHGWIGEVAVVDVLTKDGKNLYITNEKVELGKNKVRLDWTRRFDFMQQHTGQHLLTALVLKTFGWMTVGFHIGPEESTIDLDTPRITPEQRVEIESMVNDAILAQIPVRAIEVTRDAFALMDIRSRGVPDWVEGPIRLIEIEGIDTNNCGGTHVRNSSELQLFAIVGLERMKKKTRLSFVYGTRLLHLVKTCLQTKARLNDVFQSGAHVERARAWAQDRKDHKRERKQWNEYRAAQEGARLFAHKGRVIVEQITRMDLGVLKEIIQAVVAKSPQKSVLLYSETVFVLYCPCPSSFRNAMDLINQLGGRGGGRLPNAQGKWQNGVDLKVIKVQMNDIL